MRFITARFKSKCAETGATINRGDSCLYDSNSKLVYCKKSKKYLDFFAAECDASLVEAQENAYFDNFCSNNNI